MYTRISLSSNLKFLEKCKLGIIHLEGKKERANKMKKETRFNVSTQLYFGRKGKQNKTKQKKIPNFYRDAQDKKKNSY